MADGQPRSYTQNAQVMAAGAPGCSALGCPSCIKAGLPVLLARPGLGERSYANGIRGAIAPLLSGVADPELSYSGYVMRTLRRGYVYAYYETPHTPEIKVDEGWQVFSVDDGGYLSPHSLGTLPLVGSDEQPAFSCQRTAGYASAMLFVIPNAKQTDRVWVAFTDHPWSEKVRQEYASSEEMRNKRMTCVNAKAASCERSVPLTAGNIRQAVADYTELLPDTVLRGNPHPRLFPKGGLNNWWDPFPIQDESRPSHRGEAAEDVVAEAEKILKLGKEQFALDDAMIVSVCDAVGATTEAAQLRMTLCSSAAEWALQQAERDADKAQWKVMSALSVDGLLNIIEQQGSTKQDEYPNRYGQYHGRRVTQAEYNRMKEEGELPPDARFSPFVYYRGMSSEERRKIGTGTIQIPTSAEIERETGNLKEDVLDKLQPSGGKPAYRAFLDTYQAKAREDEERRGRVERDYFAWLDSPARKQVTAHDFDEDFIVDGVFYCDCVSKLTFAGPLTDNGLEWYRHFLTDDPEDKENLLLRALLGNQKSAFEEWVSKKKGPYGQLKSVVSELEKAFKAQEQSLEGLSEANKRLLRWLPYLKIGLASMASPVLTVAGAVATGLSKREQIATAFRQRLEILAGVIAGHSSGARQLALLKVQMSLQDAARFWRRQIGALQSSMRTLTSQVRGQQVQSLVLDGAIALEARGAQQAGDALVDVYIWVRNAPEAIGDALEDMKDLPSRTAAGASAGAGAVAQGAGRYVLRPAAANLNRAWQGAARLVTRTQLDRLARNSVVLASNGGALLATGSGVFSTLALLDAWGKFEHGNAEERKKAAVSILTSGLGVSSALLSLGAEMAKQAAKEAAEKGLKRAAGIVGAIATFIDAAQGFINSGSEFSRNDTDAGVATIVQSFLLVGAGVAGVVAAFGGGGIAILGLSVTGWGLILVALGIIAGFVVAALQDSPTEEWATRSIWGEASDKWGSHQREQEELNKLMMGVQVDFDYRSTYTNAGNYGRSLLHQLNPVNIVRDAGKTLRGEQSGPQMMREAWGRIMMPEALLEAVPFVLRFVAKRKDGREARVAYYARRPDGTAWVVARRGVERQNDTDTVNPEASEETKGGIWTLELSAQLDVAVYEDAWAEVLIYADPDADEAPVVNHTLRES